MSYQTIDLLVIAIYFVILLGIGFWKGIGCQKDSGHYFFSKGLLPWWAIGCAYVATGMNTEQLVGQNGMGYTVGLTMVNWYYTIIIFVYSALIFFFFPLYLRNNIRTMPEYLGRRFCKNSENIFAVMLLISYIFMNLAVVFYGGAKILHVVFGWNFIGWLVVLAVVAGIYTTYGGMSSMVYTAVFQFILIFASGAVLFYLGYIKLPHGWEDVKTFAPGGYHLIQPANYPVIPWHAIPLTLLGLHLYYSCISQAMVQRGFGARSEWDVRIAIVFCGFAVFLRPFIEIFPGMIGRALAFLGYSQFDIGVTKGLGLGDIDIDRVFPILIKELIPAGLRGFIIIGILSSVMSTIAALMNSISTLITFDVYKKWINKNANEQQLVKVGMCITFALMLFGVAYSPLIGRFGGIFMYFQATGSYVAVPIATVFLLGMFWRRSTPVAALTIMIAGIPIGILVAILTGGIDLSGYVWTQKFVPIFSKEIIEKYSLNNFFIGCGITQAICVIVMFLISLLTVPRPLEEIRSLMWSRQMLRLPPGEPKRALLKSVPFWWSLFVIFYIILVIYLW